MQSFSNDHRLKSLPGMPYALRIPDPPSHGPNGATVQCMTMELVHSLFGEQVTKPVEPGHYYWCESAPHIRAILTHGKAGGIAIYSFDVSTSQWGWRWNVWSETPVVSL